MASYLSKFTGERIDELLSYFDNRGLENVDGFVKRDASTGQFYTAVRETAAVDGEDLSLVTTGDIAKWDAMIPQTWRGAASGVAATDANNLILTQHLPAYVDDIIEGYIRFADQHCYQEPEFINIVVDESGKNADQQSGKIYVNLSNSNTYRWSGSQYVEISKSLALGETSNTAYRGDRGKAAYDHSQAKGAAFDGTSTGQNGVFVFKTNSEGHLTEAVKAVFAQLPIQWSDLAGLGAISGGYNTQSNVSITPTTISIYSMTSDGSVSVGSAASYTSGTFNAGALTMIIDSSNNEQLNITFTPPSHGADTFVTNVPTSVTLPTRNQINNLWNGYSAATAAAQTFTPTREDIS